MVTVVNLKHEPDAVANGAVLIDRRTRWGNPFVIGRDGTREQVIARYRADLWRRIRADGAHDIASELVRGLTHPQLDLLGRLGARLGTKLLATQCEHPGGRLDDPRRQAGKIDGRRRRRR